MSWSENNPYNIGCDYCVMSQIDYLRDRSTVGCNPKDVVNIKINNEDKPSIIGAQPIEKYYSYKDLRKQCKCIKYDK